MEIWMLHLHLAYCSPSLHLTASGIYQSTDNEKWGNIHKQDSLLGAVWLRSRSLRSISQMDLILFCKERVRKFGGIVWLPTAISPLHLLHLAGGELRSLLLAHFDACTSPSADLPFFFFFCLSSFLEESPDPPASNFPGPQSKRYPPPTVFRSRVLSLPFPLPQPDLNCHLPIPS